MTIKDEKAIYILLISLQPNPSEMVVEIRLAVSHNFRAKFVTIVFQLHCVFAVSSHGYR